MININLQKIKTCSKCKEFLPVSFFYIRKNRKAGFNSCCIQCNKKYSPIAVKKAKERRILNSENFYKQRRLRYKEDILYRLKHILRARLIEALNSNQKKGSAIANLGMSIIDFKQYLESKFQPGMTWDNQGYYGWHIDHIIPLSSAKTSEELIKLCHYTNLQPLWMIDNLSKGSKA